MTQRVRTSVFLIWGFLGHRYIERVSSMSSRSTSHLGCIVYRFIGFFLAYLHPLVIYFRLVIICGEGQEIRLTGFNWPLEHVHPGDGALMKQHLPKTNLARIIGVLWDNSHSTSDCMTE